MLLANLTNRYDILNIGYIYSVCVRERERERERERM
jgi:hypothetical protein